MRNKYQKRYSYTEHDSRKSKFINKNFNKTINYKSNFSNALFKNTAFIGAKFKFCSFYKAEFTNCYIRGVLFRTVNLKSCIFKDCIISASTFDRCKLEGVKFEGCKIVSSGEIQKLLPASSFKGTETFYVYPSTEEFTPDLIKSVEQLRSNRFIRKSGVLHRKKKQIVIRPD